FCADKGDERAWLVRVGEIRRFIRRLQGCASLQLEGCFSPEKERLAEIIAGREAHHAARLAGFIEGLLNGGSINGLAIAFGAKLPHIKNLRGNGDRKRHRSCHAKIAVESKKHSV